jgi:hypothetical protein
VQLCNNVWCSVRLRSVEYTPREEHALITIVIRARLSKRARIRTAESGWCSSCSQLMNQTVFVHDPYDVFLAVGFVFCYGSALIPAFRTLERYKERTKSSAQLTFRENLASHINDKGTCFVRFMALVRGVLTIVGLACLYGWYSVYLKRFYGGEVPAYRVFIDWLSLGLFAVGANCWDNEDHHEALYSLVQGCASLSFGITCWLALPSEADKMVIPLIKAIYWCVIIINAYVFYLIVSCSSLIVFKKGAVGRGGFVALGLIVLVTAAASAVVDFKVFTLLNIATALHALVGVTVFTASGGIFIAIAILAILVQRKTMRARISSAVLTIMPMSILIWVTFKNYKTLFPN